MSVVNIDLAFKVPQGVAIELLLSSVKLPRRPVGA